MVRPKGIPRLKRWTRASATALAIEPQITQRIGNSPSPTLAEVSPRNDFISTRQRRNSEVSPPATSTPTPGHKIQSSISRRTM